MALIQDWFYRNHGESTDSFFKFADPSAAPYPVIRSLVRCLRTHKVGKFKSMVDGRSSVVDFGMAWSGEEKPGGTKKKNRLVIHWPTLYRNISQFVIDGCPEIAAFAWQYSSVIAYKAPVLHEFYKRQLTNVLSTQIVNGLKERDLSSAELSESYKLQKEYLDSPELYAMCREMFALTWGDLVIDDLSARNWAVLGTDYNSNDISILEVDAFNLRHFRRARIRIKTPHVIGTSFPISSSPLAREIYCAARLDNPELGVFVYPVDDCLVINMREYINYRSNVNLTFQSLAPTGKAIPTCEYSKFFVERISGMFPEFISLCAFSSIRERIDVVWPGCDYDDILLLSLPSIYKHARIAHNLEQARKHRSPKNKYTAVGAPKPVEVVSPKLSDFEGKEYTVLVFKKGKYLYIKPDWSVSLTPELYLSVPPDKRASAMPGVVYDDVTNSLYFTYDKLCEVSYATFMETPILRDWVWQLSEMDIFYLKALRRKEKRRRAMDGFGGRSPNFTVEEVMAITSKVRPNMTDADKDKLREICQGRSWSKIMVKAAMIRKELIAKGVKDIEQLPHLNFNSNMRKELGIKDVTKK